MAAIVELVGVVKEYPLGKLVVQALRGVDLTIERGEFTTIAGPSGSGKTTLLNLIGCVDIPTRGTVIVEGSSTEHLDDRALTDLRLHKLGFIFQTFNLVAVLSLFQNVEFPLLLQGGMTAEQRKKRVEEMVEKVGLSAQMRQRPNELSGGQRQRVAIARALVTKPQIVLADEPTANLDSATGQNIIDLMRQINKTDQTTFIFSTHDQRVMDRATRVVRIADGLITDNGQRVDSKSGPAEGRPPGELMQALDSFGVLGSIAMRSLYSHKVKSLIVGSIMFFGTFLVVLGTALLDSVEHSMAKSITSSIAGHLQIYAADARDPLALFGSMSMGAEDIGRIPDFEQVRDAVQDPNVSRVVPMGLDMASVSSPSELNQNLAELRRAVREKDAHAITNLRAHVRQTVQLMRPDLANTASISADKESIKKGLADIDKVLSDDFWKDFEREPIEGLEFLDTRIAPLAAGGRMLYMRYLGTDLDLFANQFDSFEVVDGQRVPTGKRGFLFSKRFYEDQVKNKVARELDWINKAINERGLTIATDGLLAARINQLPRQYPRITFELDPDQAAKLEAALGQLLPEVKGDLVAKVQAFLTVDEENIAERKKFFYDVIAPMLKLYDVKIGDLMTIRAFTRSGYLKSVNVKVYGTFNFKGLERSDLAGAQNLVDIVTFRDLYGLMTPDRLAELKGIREAVGVKAVNRGNAEDALFGESNAGLVDDASGQKKAFDEFAGADLKTQAQRAQEEQALGFDQKMIDQGMALNAAIILKDPTKLKETAAAIRSVAKDQGLNIQVVDWQTAAGIIGQFIIVIRVVLYVAIFIIFIVALVIINNSMVTATMERVTEIGTMRAIGAQRSFVMSMFLLETLALGLLAGTLGVAAGAAAVLVLGQAGIPASTDILVFLFAGPRLYPTLGIANLLVGLIAILMVSIVSTLYPARIATRIQPVVAMQAKE